MLLYQIYKSNIYKYGNIKNAIQSGYYITCDDDFIKNAFNLHNGTKKDFNRYMQDNKRFCIWYDPKTKRQVTKI